MNNHDTNVHLWTKMKRYFCYRPETWKKFGWREGSNKRTCDNLTVIKTNMGQLVVMESKGTFSDFSQSLLWFWQFFRPREEALFFLVKSVRFERNLHFEWAQQTLWESHGAWEKWKTNMPALSLPSPQN